jgi:hypothetical protein
MHRAGAFTGSLISDVIAWGLGGQLFGGLGGYWFAEQFLKTQHVDPIWFSARVALRVATVAVVVPLWGHLFVTMVY